MPAAAVIPAPIAYIKVVAVKKLVVGFLDGIHCPLVNSIVYMCIWFIFCVVVYLALSCWVNVLTSFTVKKLECLKQALAIFEYISME